MIIGPGTQVVEINGEGGIPIPAEDLPITVGIPSVEIPIPGLPVIPKTELNAATDISVAITYTCPGFPLCGKSGEACKWEKQSEIISVNGYLPIPEIDLNLLPLPQSIGPFGGGSIEVPPRSFRPFNCANYPQRDPRL